MIDEPPVLTVARNLQRPDAALVERFRGVPTSFICDAQGGAGALDWRIKPVTGSSLLGVAMTCHCGPADILALSAAVQLCKPGDILIAATDGHTGTAVVGDLMLGIAKNRGAVGFVTDGLVRDRNDLDRLGLAVYAIGVSPNSPHSHGPGTVGLPIVCGGRSIAPGDIVIGDRDGVVTVPLPMLAKVLAALETVKAAEAGMLQRVQQGLDVVASAKELLAGSKVQFV